MALYQQFAAYYFIDCGASKFFQIQTREVFSQCELNSFVQI